jgi:hypothetical protein
MVNSRFTHKNKLISFWTLVFVVLFVCYIYAGTIDNADGHIVYRTDNNEYAKNCWVWLDVNNDSVKECYRFDENGHIASNYIGPDGRQTNEKGQLVENGFVVHKLMSGQVIKGDGTPYVSDTQQTGIINSTNKDISNIFPTKANEIVNNIIVTTRLSEDSKLIPSAHNTPTGTRSNIIFTEGGRGLVSTINNKDYASSNNSIVPGKRLTKYIKSKSGVKTDIEEAVIYGGEIWKDVVELRGNNSYIKINTKNFNYMYFEVASENYIADTESEDFVEIEVYIDGDLAETLDAFFDEGPQVEEIEELDAKEVELRLKITGRNKSRKAYIRNGVLRKIKDKDE